MKKHRGHRWNNYQFLFIIYTHRKCLAHFFIMVIIYIYICNLNILWLSVLSVKYTDKLKSGTSNLAHSTSHSSGSSLLHSQQQDPGRTQLGGHPSLFVAVSPLMFGHNVSSVHHCHTGPAQLLRGDVNVKLSHHRAVVRRHPAPRPVVRDPGVSQTFPHHHVVACQSDKRVDGSQVNIGLMTHV